MSCGWIRCSDYKTTVQSQSACRVHVYTQTWANIVLNRAGILAWPSTFYGSPTMDISWPACFVKVWVWAGPLTDIGANSSKLSLLRLVCLRDKFAAAFLKMGTLCRLWRGQFLPHSAQSWNLSQAESLAISILLDGAMEWHYSYHIPTTHQPPPYLQLKFEILCGVPTLEHVFKFSCACLMECCSWNRLTIWGYFLSHNIFWCRVTKMGFSTRLEGS